MELPMELKTAIEAELAEQSAARLAHAAAELSDRYRSGNACKAGFVSTAEDAAAYAATRLPATYAAVRAALLEAAKSVPGFQPRSLLDAGAGPGTASWAALGIWPELESVTLLERESAMIELGKRLAERAPAALGAGEWLTADLAGNWETGKHDAVILSYALGELGVSERERLLRRLWEAAAGLLVVVEPGTPAGFAAVLRARDLLTSVGAAVAAPCPGACACPMRGGNWCHFSARVARSRLHRQAKGAEMSYEDEKFSYIALVRNAEVKPCAARVVRHPQILKGHVKLELCTGDGLRSQTVAKSRGEIYKRAKDLRWGDATLTP